MTTATTTAPASLRWRRTIVAVETLMALAAAEGAVQLIAGVATPPDRQLPLGMTSWALPGVWLMASVALPSATAAAFAVRRHPRTTSAVTFASVALGIELVVQIPFLGVSWLQLVCGVIAVVMTLVALDARRRSGQEGVSAGPAAPPAAGDALDVADGAVDLYWLPLGAGGRSVRWNGRVYEALAARHEHRSARDLYHSALEVRVGGERYVIEMAPVWNDQAADRGSVSEGSVGAPWLGRSRWFRYEVRCWRGGHIPDIDEAVASPQRLCTDAVTARALLATVPLVPRAVWGRDELQLGEMWNSNSLVAWLLACHELAEGVAPPAGGRAPGWDAGLHLARLQSEAPTAQAGGRPVGAR